MITLFRWAQIILVQRPLNTDEAQYWLWSQSLSLGYHSKPPLIAYITRITTTIFGNNLFGVKCFVPLSYAITTSFIFFSIKKIANKDIALASAMSFFLCFGVSYSSTILSTDPFMLLFWSMAFYYLVRVLVDGKEKSWLVVGLGVGLSILSKYTGGVFLFSLIVYFLFEPSSRKAIKTLYFPLAILITLAIIFPNIYWNLTAKHSAINHVLHENIGVNHLSGELHLGKFFEFVGAQMLVISPVLFPFILYALFTRRTFSNGNTKLLWCFAFPMFAIVCLQALVRFSYANWAVAMYISAIPLAYYLLAQTRLYRLTVASHFALGLMFVMTFAFLDFAVSYGFVSKAYMPKMLRNSLAWPKLSSQLMAYRQEPVLFTNREIWSESVYYGKFNVNRVYTWPTVPLDGVGDFSKVKGENFIYFTYYPTVSKTIMRCFAQSKSLQALSMDKLKGQERKLYIFKLLNFQGEACFKAS